MRLAIARAVRRVRFETSLPAATQAGLELSSRLLGIALRVEQSSGLHHAPRAQFAAQRGSAGDRS